MHNTKKKLFYHSIPILTFCTTVRIISPFKRNLGLGVVLELERGKFRLQLESPSLLFLQLHRQRPHNITDNVACLLVLFTFFSNFPNGSHASPTTSLFFPLLFFYNFPNGSHKSPTSLFLFTFSPTSPTKATGHQHHTSLTFTFPLCSSFLQHPQQRPRNITNTILACFLAENRISYNDLNR